ncbi:hypothetical protein [Lysinibacillus sp. 54212]|uniref:hypothetical protein n=1 Tax=Lysinibacillus sp. 54212 TaxID=3119829 RepID=UPI002FCCB3F0
MKKSLRAFGIGIFLAGASFTVYEKFESPLSDKQKAEYKEEIKDLNEALKEANDKLEKLQDVPKNQQDNSDEQPEKTSNTSNDETGQQKQTDDIVYGSIYIYEGVTLYDIGKQAEDAGVVQNGRELELFLYKKEYARSIQKGQFDLSSNMSIEEIAKIITGKKIEE